MLSRPSAKPQPRLRSHEGWQPIQTTGELLKLHWRALRYLARDGLSVKEVAYNLGFNDASNFSRAFRRWEGVTPKVYRQN